MIYLLYFGSDLARLKRMRFSLIVIRSRFNAKVVQMYFLARWRNRTHADVQE